MKTPEEAAAAYAIASGYTATYDRCRLADGFEAGIAWRDANPSAEVLALVEALEFYARGFTSYESVEEQTQPPGWRAREALSLFAKQPGGSGG